MAGWIESWDLEAMTSYNQGIGVCSPVGTRRLEFFTQGSHPRFVPTKKAESVLAEVQVNSSKY